MNSLSQNWSSPAGESIVARFNALDSTFENYYKIIENYASFLDQAVETYDSAENTINAGASSFQ